ncbi:MAG TPA: squalene synthase HpnC [Actinocrinis sp.]|uniref:squalene synthase HpnC n=1 Tax=Actinocrinis sp. TaxID=1920516 RepID=UPI002DDCC4A8|nr:squalene synthase HpnC [Actinocrinis sp.]HEV3169693.1 squalene synthase HpnC [Actinocrinis sp.]
MPTDDAGSDAAPASDTVIQNTAIQAETMKHGAPPDAASDMAETVSDTALAAIAAQAQAENFPVALRFLPRGPREDLGAFYCFARYVDDLGDEYQGDRVAALTAVDEDIARLASGAALQLAPVRGLARLTEGGRVPTQPFTDLVAANLMDQHKPRYATFGELVDYCKLSANPVGQVVLYLAGQATEQNVADSDAVCTGLQIIEHIQDVAEDYRRADRIYMPQEDLASFGVAEDELTAPHADEDLKALLRWEAGRAAVLLGRGVPLVRRLRGWARPAVTGYVAGGRAALAALRRADFDVLAHTPTPTKAATVRAAFGVLIGRPR